MHACMHAYINIHARTHAHAHTLTYIHNRSSFMYPLKHAHTYVHTYIGAHFDSPKRNFCQGKIVCLENGAYVCASRCI